MKYIKLQAGQKFNRLTVIKLDHIKEYISLKGNKRNNDYYLCKCECGNECISLKNDLKQNKIQSCGCLHDEKCKINGLNKKIHGLKYTKLYQIWLGIKKRCFNKNDKSYKDYGGRGIIMCDKWLHDPVAFYNWSMSNGYKEGLTIDRINNDGNYEPSNCRWVDMKIQQRNKRSNINITYNGETHCIKEWAEILNIPYYTLFKRIKVRKMNIQDAFILPIKKHKEAIGMLN